MENIFSANLFELSSNSIQVTFVDQSILGGPVLNYRDNLISLTFEGDEIKFEDSELGRLITVTLEVIPDLRTVTFTLVLPNVNVFNASRGTCISVPGITTTNPRSIVGPGLGPEKLYSVVNLQGTAQFIVS